MSLTLTPPMLKRLTTPHLRQLAPQTEIERPDLLDRAALVAAIVADEQAKIAREQAIRTQVRKSATGKQIKARAAVA